MILILGLFGFLVLVALREIFAASGGLKSRPVCVCLIIIIIIIVIIIIIIILIVIVFAKLCSSYLKTFLHLFGFFH